MHVHRMAGRECFETLPSDLELPLGENVHNLTAQVQVDELISILVNYEPFRRILAN